MRDFRLESPRHQTDCTRVIREDGVTKTRRAWVRSSALPREIEPDRAADRAVSFAGPRKLEKSKLGGSWTGGEWGTRRTSPRARTRAACRRRTTPQRQDGDDGNAPCTASWEWRQRGGRAGACHFARISAPLSILTCRPFTAPHDRVLSRRAILRWSPRHQVDSACVRYAGKRVPGARVRASAS